MISWRRLCLGSGEFSNKTKVAASDYWFLRQKFAVATVSIRIDIRVLRYGIKEESDMMIVRYLRFVAGFAMIVKKNFFAVYCVVFTRNPVVMFNRYVRVLRFFSET